VPARPLTPPEAVDDPGELTFLFGAVEPRGPRGGHHGGAPVRTDAPPPAGKKIRLELPEADGAADAGIAPGLEHLGAHRRRALVVDDDLLTRRMMGDAPQGGAAVEVDQDVDEGAEPLGPVRGGEDLEALRGQLHCLSKPYMPQVLRVAVAAAAPPGGTTAAPGDRGGRA
jgi:hypothetical protein